MTTATLEPTRTATEYKVADMSLADWGRKEIQIAEHEMPGLYYRFAAHDHSDRCADRDAG
jgi:hypothetical protein